MNSGTYNQDWIQFKKAKIKLKRTWSSDYMNKKTIIIGWKPQLIDYKESRTGIIKMNTTKK